MSGLSPWPPLGLGWAATAVAMALLWRMPLRTRHAGCVDVGRAVGEPRQRARIVGCAGVWGLTPGGDRVRRVTGHAVAGRSEAWRASERTTNALLPPPPPPRPKAMVR